MRRLSVIATALAFVVAGPATAADLRVDRNVVYGMYGGLALLMDVYHPDAPNGYGVVFVAGSGWRARSTYNAHQLKEAELDTSVLPLMRAGYTVFAINHRAAPEFKYPAAVEDVQRAVRFVRYHAHEYGIDPARIGGVGGSSGAHLIGLTAMLGAPGDPTDRDDPVSREPATLQCLVLRAAPCDLREMKGGNGLVALALFLNIAPGNSPPAKKVYTEASPITHVSSAAPPTLLIHGDADPTVPYAQSVAFERALRAAGVPVRLLTIPGGVHGATFGATADTRHPEWPDITAETIRWLDRHLKPAAASAREQP